MNTKSVRFWKICEGFCDALDVVDQAGEHNEEQVVYINRQVGADCCFTGSLVADTDGALAGFRICDFTGQLAGAGATKWLAAFGADVIRIEDPARDGRWDILRGGEPFADERRGINLGGAFNNHNTDKRGITLNLRTEQGKQILRRLVAESDAVTENFAAGVLDKWGFGYSDLQKIKPDIVYVSNCGFGHEGPYSQFKTWGPIVQAVSGLTYTSGLKGEPPAGWGYSYMDHTGGYYMAMAIMLALLHRTRTGEGQWVDLACSESALTLHGPALLDWSVNGRPSRVPDGVDSNRSQWVPMAPHGIYPCAGDDAWIAIACRDDEEWLQLALLIDAPWALSAEYQSCDGRIATQDVLDQRFGEWTRGFNKFELTQQLENIPLPVAPVRTPEERIERDPFTAEFGLWPTVEHSEIGALRVDGQPVKFSETNWRSSKGAPCLSEHTRSVLSDLLGYTDAEIEGFYADGVV